MAGYEALANKRIVELRNKDRRERKAEKKRRRRAAKALATPPPGT